MKRKNLTKVLSAVLFITFSVYSVVFASQDKRVRFESLPKIAKDFYTLNFGERKIKSVEYERSEKRYEIELWNNTTITFNHRGEWLEVDCDNGSTVPQGVIDGVPLLIKNKIKANYSENLILEIKRNLHDMNNIKYSIEIVEKNGKTQTVHLN